MPQLDFSGGKLMLLYYDTRFDHTFGVFARHPKRRKNAGTSTGNLNLS